MRRHELAILGGLFLLGAVAGYLAATLAGEPKPLPVYEPVAFRAFEVPDPTLPPGCCDADEELETLPPPAPTSSAPVATPRPDRPKRRPAAEHRDEGPARRRKPSGRSLSGVAVWHATGRDGLYAAAGPELRKWLGPSWRGSQVIVTKGRKAVAVRLNDWCLCSRGRRLLDLSDEAFSALAPLSRGVIEVDVWRMP